MKARKLKKTAAKKVELPLRKTGTKQAPPDLAEFIRLANLVPDGEWLEPRFTFKHSDFVSEPQPESEDDRSKAKTFWAELLEWIQDLPPNVRDELFQRSKQVNPTPEQLAYGPLESWRAFEVAVHYEKIRIASSNLRGLFYRAALERLPTQFRSLYSKLTPTEDLLKAMRLADLSYLRECAKPDCRKIFFAGKHTQLGCSTEHSNAIRQQRKRNRDKLNRHPKKRAKTAAKR